MIVQPAWPSTQAVMTGTQEGQQQTSQISPAEIHISQFHLIETAVPQLQPKIQAKPRGNSRKMTSVTNQIKASKRSAASNLETNPRICHVCGEQAGKHSYYGGQVCPSCRAFFRRSVQSK